MRRGPARDHGVSVVEAAFVLPLLLFFVFGLIDLGMWTFNANQATNAARDGARIGILGYAQADVEGSDDWDAIVETIEARLPGQTVDGVEVTCVDPDGVVLTCADARVDVDRIRVEVDWTWTLVTPVAAAIGVDEGVAEGSATMAIVGRPVPGTSTAVPDSTTTTTTTTTVEQPPEGCTVDSLDISPDPIARSGNGASQLGEGLQIDFTTNGSADCSGLRIELDSSHSSPTTKEVSCGCGDGPTSFTWTYVGSSNVWQSGDGAVRIYNGDVLLDSDTFHVN